MKFNGLIGLILAVCLVLSCVGRPAVAIGESKYKIGKTVNAVRDTGFSESIPIKDKDPHYGWELGQFYFTGYQALDFDESGNPVFYVDKGDLAFKLYFQLNYDIKKLNGTDKLLINEDKNGYDKQFGIDKTDFGFGALFIRRTDLKTGKKDKTERHLNFLYSRKPNQPFVVTNNLVEGDYEASLDYELREYYGWFGSNWWNYKIPFSFSVRYLSEDKPSETFEPETAEALNNGNNIPGTAAQSVSTGYRLIVNSEKLSKAVRIESEEEKSGVLTEYYYDPDHDVTILLMASENTAGYESPLIGENETLTDFIKSIGEQSRFIIPENEDSIVFSYEQDGEIITAKAQVYRTEHFISVAIVAAKSRTVECVLFDSWLNSLQVYEPKLEAKADGSSYGVWEIGFGNAVTVQKIFALEEMASSNIKEPFLHGFVAERANLLAGQIRSVFTGEKIKYIGGNNALNGPDFVVADSSGNLTFIQSKYYSTGKGSVDACFEGSGNYKYMWDGKPMQIEVPKGQYAEAVDRMAEKIRAGKVPGVTDPAQAKDLIREGTVTYKQALNIAKAGTVDSLKYDAKHGCVAAVSAFGISAVVEFAVSCWQNEPVDVALKRSVFTGLQVGGGAFVVSVLSSQLSRTALNQAMIPASKAIVNALGPKAAQVFVNAFRPAGAAIYGAAAKQAAAKLLRGNVITAAVSFVVFSIPNIVETFQGRISTKQLIKNTATLVGGLAGGGLGMWGGAAIGSAIAPGIGTVIGGAIGGIAGGFGGSAGSKAIADLVAEDDANEMIDIISEEYSRIAAEYLLSQEEGERVSVLLQNKIDEKFLKDMFASNDRKAFAAKVIEPIIAEEAGNRERIVMPSSEEYTEAVITVLEAISAESE